MMLALGPCPRRLSGATQSPSPNKVASEKLQNVMAVTEILPCSGKTNTTNTNNTNKGTTTMIPVILAMTFVGIALTMAFGFGLLPL